MEHHWGCFPAKFTKFSFQTQRERVTVNKFSRKSRLVGMYFIPFPIHRASDSGHNVIDISGSFYVADFRLTSAHVITDADMSDRY